MTKTERFLKATLESGGYHLYYLYERLLNEPGLVTYKKCKERYFKELNAYWNALEDSSISDRDSKPPLIYGNREDLDILLMFFVYMRPSTILKKFTIEDVMIIKDTVEEDDSYYSSFKGYPGLAILDLHKHLTNQGKYESWRDSNIMQAISTRQRDKKPTLVLSELPFTNILEDLSMFTYINLTNKPMIVHTRNAEQLTQEDLNNMTAEQKDEVQRQHIANKLSGMHAF